MRCGENVGKENRETLVECILRGFYVPGAGDENGNPWKAFEIQIDFIRC